MVVAVKPPQPIKIIALDLDGTLLRSDKTVSPRTIKALDAAHKMGVEILLASGRMTPAMEHAAAQLGMDVHIVSYNGAVITGSAGDGRKRLFHQPLCNTVGEEIYQLARARNLQLNWYVDDVIISEQGPHLDPWIELYRSRTGSPYRFVENLSEFMHHKPTKALIVTDPKVRDALEEELRPKFQGRATVVKTEHEYLEFLGPQVDKGYGVSTFAKLRNVPMAAVMAMGDAENDIQMLEQAGWSIAVKNAFPRAKAAAKIVSEYDNDHDAVADAIERWVLS